MNKYRSMQFAVRPAVVLRLLADMYGLLALLTLVPGTLALLTGSAAGPAYLGVIGALATAWLLGRLLPDPQKIQQNEALVMVALLFTSASLLLSLPVTAYGVPFLDAWFEAVSGVTTTGLSTLDIGPMPAAFLFGRAWMQWVGGIGVVVLALAIFVRPGVTASRLGFSSREMDDVVGGTRAHARRVIVIYLLLTGAGVLALLLSGAGPLDAVAHAMAAVSTGGFANYPDSLASVGSARLWVINLLCIAGAVSFYLYYRSLLSSRPGKFLDNQLYALLILIALGTAAAWISTRLAGEELGLGNLLTLVISAQTTAGFSTFAIGDLPPVLLLVLCACMAVGGGAGSTAGGIKLDRALLLAGLARRAVLRTGLPEDVYVAGDAADGGRRIEEAVALLAWFGGALLLSWMVFLAHGLPPLASLFEVTSALANVGLTAGLTGAELPATLKFILCCNMLLGRLELLAVLVLFAPRTWIGRRRHTTRRKQ